MKRKNEKDHDRRKSPGAAEVFKKKRKERNQARPYQFWVGGESVAEGGHWVRTTADSRAS